VKSRIIQHDIEKIGYKNRNFLETIEGKKILITGGNGFLPSYLVDTFVHFNRSLKYPCKLTIMNKHDINYKSRLYHLIGDTNVKFVTQDIGKNFKVPNARGLDIIIHAASRANPASFLADPLDTIDANVNGTRILLEYVKKNKSLEQFLFFSSAEVYGNPLKEFIPTPETYSGNVDCTNKWACYTESKRFAETLCTTFFDKFNVPIKIIRPLLGYGPGMRDDGRVVVDFFKGAMEKGEINIRDKGESCRSFCYVSDMTNAILTVMSKGKSGEVYNIANDTTNISIKGLANLVANTLGDDIQIKINPDAQSKNIYGTDARDLDISKIRKLGFNPKVSLEEGLYRMKLHYWEIWIN